ncbi:hypothetical protein KSP40_PGU014574 [Platanthera guangdongensis]|uniref:Phytocyanin domain-containing protein n=1 Tax=Platanthera guangdongensis TaxID=2320717 RepID=A0ABR2LI25_9ASPA
MAPSPFLFIILLLIAGCLLRTSYAHKVHVVGGSAGWKIPPNITFYGEWAATRTFVLGDRLGNFSSLGSTFFSRKILPKRAPCKQ